MLRAVLLLSGIWVIFYYGSNLLLPLLVAAMIATILDRPTKKFKKRGFPDWLAISVSILILGIVFLTLFWLISSQVGTIADDWPTISEKAMDKYELFSNWMHNTFQIDLKSLVNNKLNLIDRLKSLFTAFVASLSNLVSQSLIILIYIILFLMQKSMFIRFFKKLTENYILTPWIIGDEIDLNPFVTVFGVILLSVLWGIVGAIIALPILGMLKVLFEHTKGMGAYAFLLGRHEK